MAYNKARAEKKWLKWKEAEEKKLRELGVDEETIQRLHIYNWAEFNRERRCLQRPVEWSPYMDLISAQDLELPVEDVESLMDSIEDMELLRILSKEDKLTIQIAFLKMSGYNGYEIAEKAGLTQKAVNLRMARLRKKLYKDIKGFENFTFVKRDGESFSREIQVKYIWKLLEVSNIVQIKASYISLIDYLKPQSFMLKYSGNAMDRERNRIICRKYRYGEKV